MAGIARSVTKSVDIAAPKESTFRAVVDPMNWPRWAVVNLKSVAPAKDGWFEMTTKHGKGWLKMQANPALGLVDHQWKDEQASWTVAARVLENGSGSTFMMTFLQPPGMSDAVFEEGMQELDVELKALKQLLEKS